MKKEGKKTQVFTVWLRDDEVEEYDYLKRNGISVRHIFRTALHEAYSKGICESRRSCFSTYGVGRSHQQLGSKNYVMRGL